jgi:hypothetical protein
MDTEMSAASKTAAMLLTVRLTADTVFVPLNGDALFAGDATVVYVVPELIPVVPFTA